MKQKTKVAILWLSLIVLNIQSQQISPMLMGQNYWGTSYNQDASKDNPAIFGGGATSNTVWPQITASGVKLMRVGGKAYNTGEGYNSKPTSGAEVYYVKIVDDIRAHGCEPVLTIPFLLNEVPDGVEPNFGDPDYTNAVNDSKILAKEIIRLVNIVHKRGIRYVIIGNEADKDYGWDRTQSAINCDRCRFKCGQLYKAHCTGC